LFSDVGGDLTRVIGPGDTLFGKSVVSILMGPDAMSGRDIAFAAVFRDGSSGIYLATVPEPRAFLLGLTGCLLRLRRRRT
jgi:hypothetical protein